MNDFDYEIYLRKQLARQSKYRKRGSKSKKCSLPSDHLTTRELKERNGVVLTYNLTKPMTWKEFCSLPNDVQETYIKGLQDEFHATAVLITKMFGISVSTLSRHIELNTLDIRFARGRKQTKEQEARWEDFLQGNLAEKTEDLPDFEVVDEDVQNESQRPSNSGFMKSFTLSFSGKIDVEAIANSLRMILGDSSSGSVEIKCELA